MDRRNVKSGMFKSIGHDSASSTLEIEFNNGVVTQFHDVPVSAWNDFDKAESHAKVFHEQIKDRFKESHIR